MIPPSTYLVMLKSGHILDHNFLRAVTSVGWCCLQILSPLCPQISNITSAIPSKLCCFSLHAFLPPLTPLSQNCPVVVNQLMYFLFQSLLFGTSIQPLSPPTGHFTMAFAQHITFPSTFSAMIQWQGFLSVLENTEEFLCQPACMVFLFGTASPDKFLLFLPPNLQDSSGKHSINLLTHDPLS